MKENTQASADLSRRQEYIFSGAAIGAGTGLLVGLVAVTVVGRRKRA